MSSSYRKHKKVYCCNCGKLGHIYRNCKEPITSFGIISYKYDSEMERILIDMVKAGQHPHRVREILKDSLSDNIQLLMIRRKDTFGYVEILRGRYSLNNTTLLQRFFNIMTEEERVRLQTYSFDKLWTNFWMVGQLSGYVASHKSIKEYNISKKKFEILSDGIEDEEGHVVSIRSLSEKCTYHFTEPEWGFPKGRKNIKESSRSCAIREFYEETNVDRMDYKLIMDLDPIEEIFIGTNNLRYKHVYYVSQYTGGGDVYIDRKNVNQVSEISDIRWLSWKDGIDILRPYNIEKKRIIRVVIDRIIRYMMNRIIDHQADQADVN